MKTTIEEQIRAIEVMAQNGVLVETLNEAAQTLAHIPFMEAPTERLLNVLVERESLIMALRKNLESVLRITLKRLQDGQANEVRTELEKMLQELKTLRNGKASN